MKYVSLIETVAITINDNKGMVTKKKNKFKKDGYVLIKLTIFRRLIKPVCYLIAEMDKETNK